MISKYLNYNTTATKPCTLSACSAPAVWLHGLSLHNCGNKVLQPHADVKSRRDVCATTVCVAHSL